MFAAIFSIIFLVIMKAGGIGPIWEVAQKGGRLNFFE